MTNIIDTTLFKNITELIEKARQHVAKEFNSTHVMLNWHIGSHIQNEILKSDRAEYGKNIVAGLAQHLQLQYGNGYDRTSLTRMIKFAKLYPDKDFVATVSQQLSWSHMVELIAIEDELKRDFYVEIGRYENFSVRKLRESIKGMLYERTALSKKPAKLIKENIDKLRNEKILTADFVFRDPFFLTFTGLQKDHSEQDLENAILDELVKFIQELGSDFCFVTRQKRMSTGKKDRYLDLLMFHRSLLKLIAIELKIGAFEPAYKGQMEWYLNWLDKHERKPGEGRPLGIILCAEKDQEDIEYLELDASGIHVAQYLTELPPKELLEAKFKQAVAIAREKHERTQVLDSKEEGA